MKTALMKARAPAALALVGLLAIAAPAHAQQGWNGGDGYGNSPYAGQGRGEASYDNGPYQRGFHDHHHRHHGEGYGYGPENGYGDGDRRGEAYGYGNGGGYGDGQDQGQGRDFGYRPAGPDPRYAYAPAPRGDWSRRAAPPRPAEQYAGPEQYTGPERYAGPEQYTSPSPRGW